MASRNSLNAESNKTLRVACAGCGADLATAVASAPAERQTWALVGSNNGTLQTYPACRECYEKGWRPEGYQPD